MESHINSVNTHRNWRRKRNTAWCILTISKFQEFGELVDLFEA